MTPFRCVRPVLDKDGNLILYDIYLDFKWIGSRRTLKQCQEMM